MSFWGSIFAFSKLQGLITGNPVTVGRLQVPLNARCSSAITVACATAIVAGATASCCSSRCWWRGACWAPRLVLPIGGADMPVVISLLNAFTGLSAAATGVALNNTALIVAGMIVGASGTLLTQQMAAAMNRSIRSVVAGGFGGNGELAGRRRRGRTGALHERVRRRDPARLRSQVVIVPGYGLAVSQAQHARPPDDQAARGERRHGQVRHPPRRRPHARAHERAAGRGRGPYDQLTEPDEINPELPRTDVALVIGANDVVNPDARNNPQSPLYGMPILDVDRAHSIIVLKRSMRSGYAGVENPLFNDPKTAMLFGDAKTSINDIAEALKPLVGATATAS